MEKRIMLAMILSLFVLFSWHYFFSPLPPSSPVNNTGSSSLPTLSVPAEEERSFFFSWGDTQLEIIPQHAAIKEAIFQKYNDKLKLDIFFAELDIKFDKYFINNNRISIVHFSHDKEIIKEFNFLENNKLEIIRRTKNMSSLPLKPEPILLARFSLQEQGGRNVQFRGYRDLVLIDQERINSISPYKARVIPKFEFLALRNRYFCAIVQPAHPDDYQLVINKVNSDFIVQLLPKKEDLILPQTEREEKFSIYLGPQDVNIIKAIDQNWTLALHYGAFNAIAHILLQILGIFYKIVHNWGWSIVILSIFIYLLFSPLIWQQLKMSKKMQAIQPKINELRKLYSQNPTRLNKEIMELYQKYKINPFSGCLPLILQLPVFFALYQVLTRSIQLKNASFLWIKDLSSPDTLFSFPSSLPLLGNKSLNILPILIAFLMFWQQRLSLAAMDNKQTTQQQLLSIFLPLLFALIFYNMPAGLVLYWLINSSLTLYFQQRINKHEI